MAAGGSTTGTVGVRRGEGLQLRAPRLVVELVDEEVEGTLVHERAGGVDCDEPHAALGCQGDERRLDDGVQLVVLHRVADGVCVRRRSCRRRCLLLGRHSSHG